jgi:carbon storage regulator CsrA
MLVLTRSEGQDILIGDESVFIGEYVVKICVLGITKGKVRIGIEAPDDLRIIRNELVRKETSCESNA